MNKRGQASSEFLIVFAAVLIVATMAISIGVMWPSFTQSVKKAEADRYWSATQPFSIRQNAIYSDHPNQMVLEVVNTEPVSLTIKNITLEGVSMNFYNHTVPFSWSSNRCCDGGGCAYLMKPGQLSFLSTANFTTALNPCLSGGEFMAGRQYEMRFAISYYGSSSELHWQNGSFKLIGTCT